MATAPTIYKVTRRTAGAAGPPAAMLAGQIAYNEIDGFFYVGFGDDGAGNATSIKAFARDTFVANLPSGGTNGKILGFAGGVPVWQDAPEGAIYTAGTGLTLVGSAFGIDDAIVVTHTELDAILATLATDSEVATALAGKANTTHTHAASDITSGTLDTARIPNLDAGKITSGTFDIARIPVLPSQEVQVSSGDLTALTTPQQNAIVKGTVVTTTDGRRWVYNSGSKTLEASYIQLADITPEWAAVANKPAFATVAVSGAYADLSGTPTLSTVAISGAYSDLSGRPSLGTMAAQNANAVAITGGTIEGVILDGGTF